MLRWRGVNIQIKSPTDHDADLTAVYVETRQNPIVNRLNKTKKEREANLEQELQDKLRKEKNDSRAVAAKKVRAWGWCPSPET